MNKGALYGIVAFLMICLVVIFITQPNNKEVLKYEDIELLQVYGMVGESISGLEYARKYSDGRIEWKSVSEDGTVILGIITRNKI